MFSCGEQHRPAVTQLAVVPRHSLRLRLLLAIAHAASQVTAVRTPFDTTSLISATYYQFGFARRGNLSRRLWLAESTDANGRLQP